jgi:hypothetical protein
MLLPVIAISAISAATTLAPVQDTSVRAAPVNATARATAVRARETPAIDGRSDDAVWRDAPRFSEFRQFEPRVDTPPSFKTEFQVAYDDKHLYVFVRMFDPHPDSIMHALSRRDVRGPSDQIKVMIDSYDDKRSGYEFAVNPDGVKRDYAMSNDANEDESWNGIWDVATTVDAMGWTAEFRIPLSQLRYADRGEHTFGFGVYRDIERYKERDSWPLFLPTRAGIVSQLGRLSGLTGISTARRLEVTPYVVTKNVQRELPNERFNRDQQITFGGDLKFGVTPNVTVDATVNPDFGQVESDPAVLNLTAFETFLAEQRPFFVEGTGLYQFQLNCYIVVDCNTNEGLFYSRRIGRTPTLDFNSNLDTPTSTPIAAATKLTGRTQHGLSFGVLDAVTPQVSGRDGATVEPLTNYAVLRAQQDLRGGAAGVSVIATGVNRTLDADSRPYLHRSAYTAGATFRNQFHDRQYELAGQFAASQVQGSPEVITATQLNAVHYYQQPGDDYEVDPTRTSLFGHAEQLKFGKYGGGITRFETSVVRQSAGFDVNDLGFLRRADFLNWSTWGALTFHNANTVYRWLQVNGNHWEGWTTSGTRIDNAANLNGHMGLNNNWDVHLGGTVNQLTKSFCDRCTRGGPLLRRSRGFFPWGGVNTDSRRVVSAGTWVNLGFWDEGESLNWSLSPYVNLRFSTRFQVNIGPNISRNHDDSQWFGNFADVAGTTHYSFAHLDSRTVSMSTRLNYTVTPNLTFEFYGQPFVSSGTYSDIREVSTTPDASKYADRFVPYAPPPTAQPRTFKYTSLRTNTVVRWEYRPGSTLFVVWTQGREDDANRNPDQSWARDYRDLFGLHPDNTFLVKLAYWLNR